MQPFFVAFLLFCTVTACNSDDSLKAINNDPSAIITSHSNGDLLAEGSTHIFVAALSDLNHSSTSLQANWYAGTREMCSWAPASESGNSSCEMVIQAGEENIKVQVMDPENAVGQDEITIAIDTTEAPVAQIISPSASERYYSDHKIAFSGQISDAEDSPDALNSQWSSDIDGPLLEVDVTADTQGHIVGYQRLSEGEHAIQLTVTDSTGKTGTATPVVITVGPENSFPDCQITNPAAATSGQFGDTLILEALVSDNDIPNSSIQVTWESDKDGVLGNSTPSSNGEVSIGLSNLSVDTHTITLRATDELGAECTDNIIYTVSSNTPPLVVINSPINGETYSAGEPLLFSAQISDAEQTPDSIQLEWSLNTIIFSTQTATSSGTAQFTDDSLESASYTLVLTATDDAGLRSDALVTFSINSTPTQPDLVLAPDPAYTTDDLTAQASGSVDPDGGTITYNYEWYLNGSATGQTGAILSNSQTSKGQVWSVYATASDGIANSPAAVESLVISNSPPVISALALTPNPASSQDTITCVPTTSDADGDTVQIDYIWQIDGQTQNNLSNSLAGPFDIGSEIYCLATPNDGNTSGTAAEVSLIIENTLPVVNDLEIIPDPAYTDDQLQAQLTTYDPDIGQPLSLQYDWHLIDAATGMDTMIQSGSSNLLSNALHEKHDQVYVTVTASDGLGSGLPTTSSFLVISNTPPSSPTIEIWPEIPTEGEDDLQCTIQQDSVDIDGDAITYSYSWEKDGLATAFSNDTIAASNTSYGESWTCLVTPNDGDDDGTAASDTTIIEPACIFQENATVSSEQKISDTEGNFTGGLNNSDLFGSAVASIGDINSDGLPELAVGSPQDDDGGNNYGAVWLLSLAPDGTSASQQKISSITGLFSGNLGNGDLFGSALTSLGDFDADGVTDMVVGAPKDDDGGTDRGAVYVIWLQSDGTTKGQQKISDTQGGFPGVLINSDLFGSSVAVLPDINGNGRVDLVVGAPKDDDGGSNKGAIWILFLNADGTVQSHQKISDTQGNLASALQNADQFGAAITNLGDIDADGIADLAVGAPYDDDGGNNRGAVYILFLNSNGTVKQQQKISHSEGSFSGSLEDDDRFGTAVHGVSDLDGDGNNDLFVGAPGSDGNGVDRGSLWLLFLDADGTVKSHQRIDENNGNFNGNINNQDNWAAALGEIDDLNGDGIIDIVTGSPKDDDGGTDRGALWILNIAESATCPEQDVDGDGFAAWEDCDDNDATTYPNANEICDGLDNDCDGLIDDDDPDVIASNTWYVDNDGDGYGHYTNSISACQQPSGAVANNIDCNDYDPLTHPYATEIPNDSIDQDCDGSDLVLNIDPDNDADGYPESVDCNDNNPNIYPGATEIPNDGIDQDCDGADTIQSSGSICDNSCQYSGDGVCDDGGTNSSFDVCDFGTDCSDCGARDPCQDTCTPWNTTAYANDGKCDDGGPNASYSICDRGTDCSDCGSY